MRATTTMTTMAALVLAFFCIAGESVASPIFQGLGVLPGGVAFESVANGVSADGSTVAGYSISTPGGKAFRWAADTGMVDLGLLPGTTNSYGTSISADGLTSVGFTFGGSTEAFRWTVDCGMVGLSDLEGGAFESRAYAASADGSVVVGQGTSSSGPEAFRWTADGGMIGLGELPGGATESYAWGTSADGCVIVGWSMSASGREAFRWTETTGMVGLGDIIGGDFVTSYANATSADGSVVVGFGGGNQAFRWTEASGMVGLGDLPGGIFHSYAYATSADGSVVVGEGWSGSHGEEAFIWTEEDGMVSLQDLLAGDLGLDLTGWQLGRATGISANGMTIVGNGTNPNGEPEAWIATIPEPSSLSLLFLAGLMIRNRRRQVRVRG